MNWVTVIGLSAAVCTTTSFLPQALKVIKTRHTKDLSLHMYLLLTIGTLLWLTYGLMLRDPAIIMANSVTIVFSGIILFLKIKYK
ncbi:TPA: hypothetical protein HA239_06310 [Candidatus Woesearchaeota archaeon]|nr:MtN3/saliva-related transmembrane protein, conserved region [archaeon GW2011_AR15]MBS3103362.1 SemiSWEET transporter [Candidatus Woesearchaeota archaeon]HIH41988.1 hypothetical protein [Candidatus Woesearchaeota archaeon]